MVTLWLIYNYLLGIGAGGVATSVCVKTTENINPEPEAEREDVSPTTEAKAPT